MCTIESTRRAIQYHNKHVAYEAENAWWYHFFQAAGSNNYDVEYANSLRIDKVSPEAAAEKAKI